MACRREGTGRPARSGSVMVHIHGLGSRGRLVMCCTRPMMRPSKNGDAIGSRRAVREGALPRDLGVRSHNAFMSQRRATRQEKAAPVGAAAKAEFG